MVEERSLKQADKVDLTNGGVTALHSHAGGESEFIIRLTVDRSNSTVSLVDCTGLSFSAEADSEYIIEAWIIYTTSATGVGIKLSANGPTSPIGVAGLWGVNAAQGTPDGGAFNAYNVTVAASAAPFTTGNLAKLWCLLRNGVNAGTFIIRFAAETTGTVSIKVGSVLRVRKVYP